MWSGSSSAQANIGMTSPTIGDQYELPGRLVDTPGLDDFLERQANSGVIDATGGMMQAMPPVGQFTRGPLQAEDRGKTIRPEAFYTIPFIGPSLGTYVFKWVPAPEFVPIAETMPMWQPFSAMQESGFERSQEWYHVESGMIVGKWSEDSQAPKQIEMATSTAVLMGLTSTKRLEGEHQVCNITEDCPLLKKEIDASLETTGNSRQPLTCKLCNKILAGKSKIRTHIRGNCKGIWGLSPDGRKQKQT